MGDLPHMPLFVDDFEAATAHLNLEEDGAYNRLLRLCWRTAGGSVPDDDAWIQRRMRVDPETYQRLVLPIIDEFFTRARGRVFQKRQREIFDSVSNSVHLRKEAGKKGGLAKAQKTKETASSNATILPEANGKQSDSNALASRTITRTKEETPLTPPDGAVQATLFGDQDQAETPPVPQPDPKPAKRKTVFPSDWRPAEPLRDWARQRGHTDAKISALADACVNHHVAKGTLFQDLNAAFRTWVINDDRFAKPAGIGQPAPSSPHLSDAMQRRMAQRYGGGQQ